MVIVSTEYGHLIPVILCQLPQPPLIGKAILAVDLDQVFEQGDGWWTLWRGCHFTMMEIGITGMQQPAFFCPHSHTTVTTGMSVKRNQQHLVFGARQCPNGVKTEPALTLFVVQYPVRLVAKLYGSIAGAFSQRRVHGRSMFSLVDMHPGTGKIRQPACMIQIQMGCHYVTHILGTKPQRTNLCQGSLINSQQGSQEFDKSTAQTCRISHVLAAHARIYQYQPGAGLDKQTVTDHNVRPQQPATMGTQGAAIKMMYSKCHSRCSPSRP